ncbi:ParA family protein [Helicobacter sp. T3_23-1056]
MQTEAHIITIANQKGGSGKSTISANLALKLLEYSPKTLVMDTDPQKSIESFCNIRQDENRESSKLPHFHLSNRTGNISESIKQNLQMYDFIIIDTGGIDSIEARKAMLFADTILLPTVPSQYDFDVLCSMLQTITDITEINEEAKVSILMNKISPNPMLCKEISDFQNAIKQVLEQHLQARLDRFILLENYLSERIAYKRAVSEGYGITQYSDEKAKAEFERFFDEFARLNMPHLADKILASNAQQAQSSQTNLDSKQARLKQDNGKMGA